MTTSLLKLKDFQVNVLSRHFQQNKLLGIVLYAPTDDGGSPIKRYDIVLSLPLKKLLTNLKLN